VLRLANCETLGLAGERERVGQNGETGAERLYREPPCGGVSRGCAFVPDARKQQGSIGQGKKGGLGEGGRGGGRGGKGGGGGEGEMET
jgi:hypothetical protein